MVMVQGCFGYVDMSLSSLYAAHYPLDRRCSWCCGDQARASLSLLCDCHMPGRQGCSLVVGEPWSDSELYCEVAQDWECSTGRAAEVSIPLLELFTGEYTGVMSPIV